MVSGSIPVGSPSSYIARPFCLSSRVLGEGVKAETSLSASIAPTSNTVFRHGSYLEAFAKSDHNHGIFCIFAAGIVPVVTSYITCRRQNVWLLEVQRCLPVFCAVSLMPLLFSRYFPLNKDNLFWHVMGPFKTTVVKRYNSMHLL